MKLDFKYNGIDYVEFDVKITDMLKKEIETDVIKDISLELKPPFGEPIKIPINKENNNISFKFLSNIGLSKFYQYEYLLQLVYSDEKIISLISGNVYIDKYYNQLSSYKIDTTQNIAKLYSSQNTNSQQQSGNDIGDKNNDFAPDFVARFILGLS